MLKQLKSLPIIIATIATVGTMASAVAGDRVLSAEELKKLITGNTAHVTRVKDGKKWNLYFAPDGKGYKEEGKVAGTWEVNAKGEHCVTWAPVPKFACALVADIGDGKYARLKPNGDHLVIWKIETGKKL